MQWHDGVLSAHQDDAFHERAGVLAAANGGGKKRAKQVSLAFTTFEEVRLLPPGKVFGASSPLDESSVRRELITG
jgi:hypothetical protein